MPVPLTADNELLRALSVPELRRLRPHLERFPLPLGHAVHEAGRPLAHVYFPTSAIVSLLCVMRNGAPTEIALNRSECPRIQALRNPP